MKRTQRVYVESKRKAIIRAVVLITEKKFSQKDFLHFREMLKARKGK